MASEMVERLAEKWSDENHRGDVFPDEARWWLNAIADELEAAMPDNDHDSDYYGFGTADWLRTQAGDSSDD